MVFLEVLVNANVVLLGVVERAGVEVSSIEERGAAGDVVGAGGSAAGIGRGGSGRTEGLRGGTLNVAKGQVGGLVSVEQQDLGAVWLDGVREGDEGRILVGLDGGAVRSEREVGLIAGKEEELMVRDDRSAYAEGKIVGVVRSHADSCGRAVFPAGG